MLRLLLCLCLLAAPELTAQRATNPSPAGLSADDWANIRASYEAGRHRVFVEGNGLRAHNPGQQWSTRFDGRGALTEPDHGEWTWGLELSWVARGDERVALAGTPDVVVDGSGLSYAWGGGVEEWYVNRTTSLKHGLTLRQRPGGGLGPISVHFAVRGDLSARVRPGEQAVRFVDPDDTEVLSYANLQVFDARGRTLPAGFRQGQGGLRIWVDDRDATYPVTVDPDATQVLLKASNSPFEFGHDVAVSGNTVVVSTPKESSAATGINGDQSDTSASQAGAVYVFVKLGALWFQQAYIKASDAQAGAQFGFSVALDGDRLVVGARGGVDTVYVFERSGGTWAETAKLQASGLGPHDSFGWFVDVDGDLIVAGRPYAYVFRNVAGLWVEEATLISSNWENSDAFGDAVAVSGSTVAVGAHYEFSDADGVDGDQGDNSAVAAGAVYVFTHDAGQWSQQAYIKASNSDAVDRFGYSIDLDGDTLVVGAPDECSAATGVDGDQLDNSSVAGPYGSGAAYVFTRSAGDWSQQAYLKASNTGPGDNFGYSVALSGDLAVIGARQEDSEGTGINASQLGTGGIPTSSSYVLGSGAAYVFSRHAGQWAQQSFLKPDNGSFASVGSAVAIDGATVAVGAKAILQGDGSAYVFDDLPTQWLNLGWSLHGIFGVLLLTGEGDLTPGSTNTVRLRNAMPLSPALVLVGLDPVTPTPFKQGTLVPVPPVLTSPLKTDSFGEIEIPFTWPVGLPPGIRFTVQAAVADATALAGAGLSNALTGISQ